MLPLSDDTINPEVEKATGKPELTDHMSRLRSYLDANMVTTEPTCIVHGDYRLGNLILEPRRSKIRSSVCGTRSTGERSS